MLVELKCGLLKTAQYIFYNFSGLNFLQPLPLTQISTQVCLFFFAYISSPYNTTFKYNTTFNSFDLLNFLLQCHLLMDKGNMPSSE